MQRSFSFIGKNLKYKLQVSELVQIKSGSQVSGQPNYQPCNLQLVTTKLSSAIIWRFFGNINIMRVAFFNTGIGNTHKLRLL